MKVCLFCRRIHKRRKYCSDRCKAKHYARRHKDRLQAARDKWLAKNPDFEREYHRNTKRDRYEYNKKLRELQKVRIERAISAAESKFMSKVRYD